MFRIYISIKYFTVNIQKNIFFYENIYYSKQKYYYYKNLVVFFLYKNVNYDHQFFFSDVDL